MGNIAILIPAAGASRRMRGTDKLSQPVDGEPLLRRTARRAAAVARHVTVTLPDHDHPRAALLDGMGVQLVAVPDAHEGMSASLRRGIAYLPKGLDGVMVLPADMPDLDEADLRQIIDAFAAAPQPILFQGTAEDGTPGHPVLFPSDCFAAMRSLTGDRGARDILRSNGHRLRHVPLPGRHALTDLDTPEAWAAWRLQAEPA